MPAPLFAALRQWRWLSASATAAFLAVSLAAGQNPGTPESLPLEKGGSPSLEPTTPAGNAAPKTAERLREGTKLIDEVGAFQLTGDRVAFFPGNKKDSFRVLENLQLERILRTLAESRAQRQCV